MEAKELLQKLDYIISVVNAPQTRCNLTAGQRRRLANIKSMRRNIKEEGFIGGESGVSEQGILQAISDLEKMCV